MVNKKSTVVTKVSKRHVSRRARNKKRNSAPRTRSNFVRSVKQIVHSLTESKQAYTSTGNSLVKFNSGIDSTGDMVQILPYVSQGIQANARIGEQIRAKSLNVKGYIKLDINDTVDSGKLPAVIARMMVVTMKTRPCYYDATGSSATLATLLKKGGTTTGFTGVLSDIMAPINRDAFTVHYDRKFYLNQSYINAIGASAPSTTVTQDIRNTVKFFNFNVKCKNRLLKYDEDVGSDLLPTNFGPFLVLGYAYADGSSPDTLTTALGLQFDSMFTYEDA